MKRSKRKKQLIMEEQDAKGISRKKWNHTISLKLFVLLKLICIIAIPIVYFVYSPLLLLCMVCYVSLFFLAIMAERRINTSIIKSNHIKIPKLDSAIALILVVIAVFGLVMSGTSKTKKSNFKNMPNFNFSQNMNMDFKKIKFQSWLNGLVSDLKSFGSIMTGERSIFGDGKREFGGKRPPKDFVIDKDNIPELPKGDMPDMGGGGFPEMGGDFDFSNLPQRPNFEFSMNNIPVEYMFSSILTTIITILIFSVSGFGLISLFALYLKKKKFERVINEVLVEEQVLFTDAEIEKLLDFGELVAEIEENEKEDEIQIITSKAEMKEAYVNESQGEVIVPESSPENIEMLDENFNIDDLF